MSYGLNKMLPMGTLMSSPSSGPFQGPDFISLEFDYHLHKIRIHNVGLSCDPSPHILYVVLAVSNKQNFKSK